MTMINIFLLVAVIGVFLWRYTPRAIVAHGARSGGFVHPPVLMPLAALIFRKNRMPVNWGSHLLITVVGNSCRDDGIVHGDVLAARKVGPKAGASFTIDDVVLIDSIKDKGDKPWRLRKVEGFYADEQRASKKIEKLNYTDSFAAEESGAWVAFYDVEGEPKPWNPKPINDVRAKVAYIRH